MSESKKDFFVKMTTAQFFICFVFFGICFGYCRLSPEKAETFLANYRQVAAVDLDFEGWKALLTADDSKQDDPSQAEETTTEATEDMTEEAAATLPAEALSEPAFALSGSFGASASYLSQKITQDPVFPVDGWVSSSYGSRVSPIDFYNEEHKGVDIAAKEGTVIRAVMDGIVSLVDETPGRGKFLMLDHVNTPTKKIQTLYQHCSKILVEEGTVIRAGEAIALVGSTGDSTGPHLHLEYRVNGECQDPIKALFSDLYAV